MLCGMCIQSGVSDAPHMGFLILEMVLGIFLKGIHDDIKFGHDAPFPHGLIQVMQGPKQPLVLPIKGRDTHPEAHKCAVWQIHHGMSVRSSDY